jgi:hypothetical protein
MEFVLRNYDSIRVCVKCELTLLLTILVSFVTCKECIICIIVI